VRDCAESCCLQDALPDFAKGNRCTALLFTAGTVLKAAVFKTHSLVLQKATDALPCYSPIRFPAAFLLPWCPKGYWCSEGRQFTHMIKHRVHSCYKQYWCSEGRQFTHMIKHRVHSCYKQYWCSEGRQFTHMIKHRVHACFK